MKLETRFEAIQEAIAKNPEAGDEEKEELLELIKEARKIEERGFKHFMKSYIEEWDYEEDGAACTCSMATCSLKMGDVPAHIKNKIREPWKHMSAKEAAEDYIFNTPHGDPLVKECLEEWNARQAEIEQRAIELHVRMKAEGGVETVEK